MTETKYKDRIKEKVEQLAKNGDVDLHLAAKVSQQLAASVAQFKTKLNNFSFGSSMDKFFDWIPENFLLQQLPGDILKYRSYLQRFRRGSPNSVLAFVKWCEWAEYEKSKDLYKHGAKKTAESDDEEGEGGAGKGKKEDRKRNRSGAREELAKAVKSREHVRALLQMIQRHNSTKRKEGIRALCNHMTNLCADVTHSCRSLDELSTFVDSSVIYCITRLVMGMVTENFFQVVLHCAALKAVMEQVPAINGAVVLSVLKQEMALSDRMRAFMAHQKKQKANGEEEETEDPDKLADPSRGERNQRMTSILFSVIALLSSGQALRLEDTRELVQILSFCYVEHRGLRILAANLLLTLLRQVPALIGDDDLWPWVETAFFKYHKLEYLRPEAFQIVLMVSSPDFKGEPFPRPSAAHKQVLGWLNADLLDPAVMEKVASALFRSEHVTECHPAIHPVWEDYFQLIAHRCAHGESVRVHLMSFVHNIVAPFRRGASDVPRQALFRHLLKRISHIALLSTDEEDRSEVMQQAGRTVGLGRSIGKISKPTDPATLRSMSVDELHAKVHSLIRQYQAIKDSDASSNSFRAWIIKELRGCLAVEYIPGAKVPYVSDIVRFFFQCGFLPKGTKDTKNQNRCIFAFAEAFAFTFVPKTGKSRPLSQVTVDELLTLYLDAEKSGLTRYRTALISEVFGQSRDKVIAALTSTDRSLLFYDNRDMRILLFLLFLVLSNDDQSNTEAVSRAESVVPDLVRFYRKGSLKTIPVFYDLLMALFSNGSAPLHVMPLLSIVRRLVSGYLVRFAPFIQNRAPIDMLLAPLVEAYRTDEREALRIAEERAGEEVEEEDSEGEGDGKLKKKTSKRQRTEAKKGKADSEDEAADSDTDSDSDSDSDGSSDEDDEETDEDEEVEEEGATEEDEPNKADSSDEDGEGEEDDAEVPALSEDEDEGEFEEEEKPTELYINSLKAMVRSRNDPDHEYPTHENHNTKATVTRIIELAGKVGLRLKVPLVPQIFQVLLGVLRNTVKDEDDTICEAARATINSLFFAKNRFFGYFVRAEELYQLLGDIQSYLRKSDRALLAAARDKNRPLAVKAPVLVRRLTAVKNLSLSVFHYIGFLAQKNNCTAETKSTIAEFWKSNFCGKGWNMKRLMLHLKQDLYHYRHGFAYIFVPAALEKALSLRKAEGPQRMKTFVGAYAMIEAFLPRLSGLPSELKDQAGQSIRSFFEALPLKELYEISHTMLYHYFHCLRMTMEYNSKVKLDAKWVKATVAEAIDDDTIQVTKASIKQLSMLEKLLGIQERAANVKQSTSFGVLHHQHATPWRKKKSRFYKQVRKATEKATEAVLAARTNEATEEEKDRRQYNQKEIRRKDLNQRRIVKENWLNSLTKEEKEKRRADYRLQKQDRIARDKARKAQLSAARKKDFERWREEKLKAQAEAAE